MAKRILNRFADSGDVLPVADDTVPNGVISYEEGFTSRYSLDVGTDPSGRTVDREPFNQLVQDITGNIQDWQNNTWPDYVSASENNGVAIAYNKGAVVMYGGAAKVSKIDNNTTEPSDVANWVDLYVLALELGGTGSDNLTDFLALLNLGTVANANLGTDPNASPTEVYIVDNADNKFANAANNLSDLTDTNQARQNLGITDGIGLGKVLPSYGTAQSMIDRDFLLMPSTVSRTTYAELFALLGDKAGTGDGSTTFDIPDVGSLGGSEGDWTNIGSGSGAPSWGFPNGIALDQGNKDVYVGDSGLNQIWKKDGSTGSWTNISGGTGAPSWGSPYGIAVDQSTKDVYVADGGLKQIWKKDGSSGSWTNIGSGSGAPSWDYPYGIALDQSTKDVYVTDWRLSQIWKKDGSSGSWTNISGGTGAPSWASPRGIAVDQTTKDVYVCDNTLDQIWKKDGSSGSWTNISGGTGAPSWSYPNDISIDQNNKDVYVADATLSQIWKKDGSTGSWTNISGGTGAPSWNYPRGIALDQTTKDVYVTDATLDQIWKQKSLDISAPYYIKAK